MKIEILTGGTTKARLNRRASFAMVLPPDVWLDTDELQREKKYPVDSVRLRMGNPHEPGISVTTVIVLYLLKDVLGPTLKRMVKDGYAAAKKQVAKKAKAKRVLEKQKRR